MTFSEMRAKLRRLKIFTVMELAGWLCCSVPTARRRLKAWNTYTSYNCNGRYYALPEIPDFDDNGLWRCRGAFFSRHGNLKQTVSHLVTASPAGLSSAEIGTTLGIEGRSFLSHFADDLQLVRERHGRGYVWFARERATRQWQQRRREQMAERSGALSDSEAVLVLVELVRNPQHTLTELAGTLRARIPRISPGLIEDLLQSHRLAEKKGASE